MADSLSVAESPATAAASPGRYGRACKACATSKARCLPSVDSSQRCQRCQRLGKSCEPSVPAQRRKTDKKTGRVAKLEEKLDSLVMLLNNSPNAASVGKPVEQPSALPTPQSTSSSPLTLGVAQNLASLNARPSGDANSLEMSYGAPAQRSEHQLSEDRTVSVPPFTQSVFQGIDDQVFEKSNRLLDRYRRMTEYFPFVVIPPTIDARTLFKERPFLYRTIMAAAEQDPNAQRDQVRDVIQYFSLHVLQLGEKNLDLLLGILVHIAWYHFQFHALARLTNLLHEALALLFDLGLNKAPSKNPRALVLEERFVKSYAIPPPACRTLEERRAALGCFFLVSGVASYLQNMEPMRWNPYLEECLGELQKCNEYDTDSSLIRHVRMQCMAEKINSSPWFDGTDQSSEWKLYPPTLCIRALQGELKVLKSDLQNESPQNLRLFLHYYNVEMTLHEIGLSKARIPHTAHSSDFNRLEILYACLESVGHFFETFLEIPPASYWDISLVQFSQLAYALKKVNMCRIVDQICNRMDEALEYGGTEPSNATESTNIFARTTAKLRNLNLMFEAQMTFAQSRPDQMGSLETGDTVNSEDMLGFWEQDWFDIMGGNLPGL